MNDELKVELFMTMIKNSIHNDMIDELEADAILSDHFECYAISGDVYNLKVCDELNFYSNKRTFEQCKEGTPKDDETPQWGYDAGHPLSCMKTPDIPLPEKIRTCEFYITKDMEGFDDIIEFLKTSAKIILL